MRSHETYLSLGIVVLLCLSVSLGSAPLVSAEVTDEQLTEVTNFIHTCQDDYGDQSGIWWDIKYYWVQNQIWHKLGEVFDYAIDPLIYDEYYYMAGELRDLVKDYGAPPPYITEDEVSEIISTGMYVPSPTDPPDVPDIPEADPTAFLPLMMSFGVIVGMAFIGFNLTRSSHDPMPGLFMAFAGIMLAWAIGWLDTWIFVTAIALIAILSAVLWGKIFSRR